MSRTTTPAGTIRAVAAEAPELALIAATIRCAIEDAQAGDEAAVRWLAGPVALHWLRYLAPADADPAGVQARLVARLPPARAGP